MITDAHLLFPLDFDQEQVTAKFCFKILICIHY